MPTVKGAVARLKKPFLPNVERNRHKWLRRYISEPQGVFIEAGANDGFTQSNTLYLERLDGWTGLLIEPIPSLVAKCRNNRTSPVAECALVPPEQDGQLVPMTYANLMSVVDGVGSAHEQEAHLNDAKPHLHLGEAFYRLDVPGRVLSDVLDEHEIRHVDLACIDLEGFEAPALRGLDFRRHQPTWLLVEARYRRDVDEVLGNAYEAVAQDGSWDVLYHLKKYQGRL